MQIAWKLDPTTIEKLKKSVLIGSSGFAVGLVGILVADPQVLAYLTAHPILALAVSSYMPVLINSINEWRKGQALTPVEPSEETKPDSQV